MFIHVWIFLKTYLACFPLGLQRSRTGKFSFQLYNRIHRVFRKSRLGLRLEDGFNRKRSETEAKNWRRQSWSHLGMGWQRSEPRRTKWCTCSWEGGIIYQDLSEKRFSKINYAKTSIQGCWRSTSYEWFFWEFFIIQLLSQIFLIEFNLVTRMFTWSFISYFCRRFLASTSTSEILIRQSDGQTHMVLKYYGNICFWKYEILKLETKALMC